MIQAPFLKFSGQVVAWFKQGLIEIVRVIFLVSWPIVINIGRFYADIKQKN